MKTIEQDTVYAFLFLLAIFFSSCEKENKTVLDILRSKAWKIGIIDKNVESNPRGRISYHPFLECEKDDSYIFLKNGLLKVDHGSERCDDDNTREKEMEYSYDKNTNQLVIDGVEYQVLDMTETQVKYCAPLPPAATGYDWIIYILQ